ncbi:MAG: calcium/sodium antiporter [Clostridiales bacterium]|nr:calcium/sodium antiporter [Clostridiales bacterium]
MIPVLLLIIGFAVLIKGADWLVEGATCLARKLNVSDLVIGLTIVALGTSLPELFVNIFASVDGNVDIAIGNVIGSNIFNILVILGVASLIYPLRVMDTTVWNEIPLSLLAAVLTGLLANDVLVEGRDASMLSRSDGIVFIAFFIIFLYYTASLARCGKEETEEEPLGKQCGMLKAVGLVLAGFVGLVLGGKLVVDSAVYIASKLGVSQSLIGLTIVALGTSLPELATSIVAALKKNADIAVGNVVGSNIFNIFFILGASSLIRPLPFSAAVQQDVLVAIGASMLLFLFMFTGKWKKLDRWEGAVFVVLYMCYLTYTIMRG